MSPSKGREAAGQEHVGYKGHELIPTGIHSLSSNCVPGTMLKTEGPIMIKVLCRLSLTF